LPIKSPTENNTKPKGTKSSLYRGGEVGSPDLTDRIAAVIAGNTDNVVAKFKKVAMTNNLTLGNTVYRDGGCSFNWGCALADNEDGSGSIAVVLLASSSEGRGAYPFVVVSGAGRNA
jgi:hypothetical protein